MQNKGFIPKGLEYLRNKPKRLFWKVIAPEGAEISYLQQSDLIFDQYDLKMRQISVRFS